MRHSFDTYRLYADEKVFTYSVRVKVTMKETVDAAMERCRKKHLIDWRMEWFYI